MDYADSIGPGSLAEEPRTFESLFQRRTVPLPAWEVPPNLGRFHLQESIGQGCMGEVWRAYDPIRQAPVVLKLLPAALANDPVEISRVHQSFLAVESLQHRHICPVYDLGKCDRLGYYLVMKYIPGTTLAQHWQEFRNLPFAQRLIEAVKILRPLADALDYAHANGVIHRDIKPANVMMESPTGDPQIIDFGLASSVHSSLSRLSMQAPSFIGSPAYMAPEQFRGRPPSHQTDQYALATMAYEMLANDLPYVAQDLVMLRHCVLHESIPRIDGAPREVNQALRKALAKEPELRFPTCSQFVAALARTGDSDKAPTWQAPSLGSVKTWEAVNSTAVMILALCLGANLWMSRGESGVAPGTASGGKEHVLPTVYLQAENSLVRPLQDLPRPADAVRPEAPPWSSARGLAARGGTDLDRSFP